MEAHGGAAVSVYHSVHFFAGRNEQSCSRTATGRPDAVRCLFRVQKNEPRKTSGMDSSIIAAPCYFFQEVPMKSLLSFDTMFTPRIITVIYFLMLVGVLIGGVVMIFNGQALTGILTILFGGLGTRVYCEILIVVFKMNEALQELRKK
jgi:hypothetical protein